jgi:glucose-1-phosphatase
MLSNMGNIKNVLFDLGGVILDIDPARGLEAFRKLGVPDMVASNIRYNEKDIFLEFEKGLISEKQFIEKIKQMSGVHMIDEEVLAAWNTILQDLPKERVDMLHKLHHSSRFRVFLLSNTNPTHIRLSNQMLREQTGIESLEILCEKAYYSYRLQMRKPDAEIFHYVLDDSSLKPEETLFVDDSKVNIDAARQLGIESFHLSERIAVNDLFSAQSIAKWI